MTIKDEARSSAHFRPIGTCDRLYCLTLGHEYIPHGLIVEDAPDDRIMRLPFTSLLAHSPDGWFLFDTGLGEDFARDESKWSTMYKWGAPELPGVGDPLQEALERCGVRLSEIAGVVMSHLHVDHTGGLPHFVSGPPVYVQRAELDFGLSDLGPAASYWQQHFADDRIRWHLLDGDSQIATGIAAFSSAGHAPGHMSYVIDMDDTGPWVFAFDAVPMLENIELDRPINTGSRASDAPQRRVAHNRVLTVARETGAQVIPGHCPVTWPKLHSPPEFYR